MARSWFDDIRGIASINGALIYSDPLVSVRHDRVMPLWPEEHLATARLLNRCLAENLRVLDIGTGSGVFAIQAALKRCRTLAVDCNSRALAFAMGNARRNGINANINLGEPNPGWISFRHMFITPDTVERVQNSADPHFASPFDVIIITPPYNLSYQPLSPALHAEAGEDGQEVFRQMAIAATALLADEGSIVCNQMSTVDAGGTITAVEHLRQLFAGRGKGLTATLIPCLQESQFDTSAFLHGQYAALLDSAAVYNPTLYREITAYIERLSGQFPQLAMFSLAARFAPIGTFNLKVDDSFKKTTTRYHRTWQDRISLHAQIVATSVPPRALSLPDLRSAVRDVSSSAQRSDLPAPRLSHPELIYDADSLRREATRRLGFDIDSLDIAAGDLEAVGLDFIVVDAAPLSENVLGYSGLNQEVTVWWSSRLLRLLNEAQLTIANGVVATWQANTRYQQRVNVGPFLHPWFTGAAMASGWTLMQHSVRFRTNGGGLTDSLAAPAHWYSDWSEAIGPQVPNDDHVGLSPSGKVQGNLALFEGALPQLQVSEPTSVAAAIASSERLAKLIQLPRLRKREHEFQLLRRKMLRQTKDGGLNVFQLYANLSLPERALAEDLFGADADYCHLRMHRSLDTRLNRLIGKRGTIRWSSLEGIPLRIREISESRRSPGLPEQYRGGLWIYAASFFGESVESSVQLEDTILKAAKALWLNYLDRFALKSAKDMVDQALHSTAHQLAHLASSVASSALEVENKVPRLVCDGILTVAANLKLFQAPDTERNSLSKAVPLDRILNCAFLAGQERLIEDRHSRSKTWLFDALAPLDVETGYNSIAMTERLKQEVTILVDPLPQNWTKLEGEARFVVLIFHAAWQAFYHALEYKLRTKARAEFSIRMAENADGLQIEVANSGSKPESSIRPKDADAIASYAKGMHNVDSRGPVFEDGLWRVTLEYR